ncbi:MAG: hydroxyacylglutathione hydrolase [Solirubrobacteraceae bacterium]|nr:hydroxyacylglutathione hydrolase [Solirubrobacteraceae bacterium]
MSLDVRMFTVGQVQENCFLVRREDSDHALMVDPGEEADKLLGAIEALGVTLDAILLTHTHFDHVGAVAPVARATGAPVYCPQLEVPVLQDIMAFVPWPGFGPYESWDPEHTVAGGERLELAGLDIDVHFTPGHSPGHVAYAIADDQALFSGDVLFQGSVGRTDLPGGDWPTLARSIQSLLDAHPDETTVYPGHMGITTLGRERASNPFLAELAQ